MRKSIASSDLRQNQSFTAGLKDIPFPAVIYVILVITPAAIYIGPLYLTVLRIYLVLMIIPSAIKAFRTGNKNATPIDIMFIGFIVWWALSFYNNNPERFFQQIGSFSAEFLGGYFIARAYITDTAKFTSLIKFIAFLLLILFPFSLVESITGRPIIVEAIEALPTISSVRNVNIEQRLGLERVQNVFAHPIHYGLFASAAFSLTIIALRTTISTKRRYLYAAIIITSVFLSLSSGAYFSIVIQIFLISYDTLLKNYNRKWWILFGLAIIAYIAVDLLSNRTPIRVFMSYATFSPHNAYWRGIIFEWGLKNIFGSQSDGIPAAWLLGIGQNDWVRPWYMHSGSMDNFWLLIAVQGGVPSFLLLISGYIYGILKISGSKISHRSVNNQIKKAWLITFVGLSFTLTTVHIWGNIFSFVFFMFGSGIWLTTKNGAIEISENLGLNAKTSNKTTISYSRFRDQNESKLVSTPSGLTFRKTKYNKIK